MLKIPKRCTLFCGHYGSGKTNLAVNFALALKAEKRDTIIADLDIVNPYFRTADSTDLLLSKGITVVSLPFARSNVDLPSIPSEAYALVQNREKYAVMDIGGDDRGAYALGRFVPYLIQENNYDMLFVANFYRPLTRTPKDCAEVLAEIETASGIRFSGIVNNSNLGEETTADTVLATVGPADELARMTGLPLVMTSAEFSVADELRKIRSDVFPMCLQKRPTDKEYRFS